MEHCEGVATTFLPRDEVLEPLAVVAVAQAARALARRLLLCSDDELGTWTGVGANDILVRYLLRFQCLANRDAIR